MKKWGVFLFFILLGFCFGKSVSAIDYATFNFDSYSSGTSTWPAPFSTSSIYQFEATTSQNVSAPNSGFQPSGVSYLFNKPLNYSTYDYIQISFYIPSSSSGSYLAVSFDSTDARIIVGYGLNPENILIYKDVTQYSTCGSPITLDAWITMRFYWNTITNVLSITDGSGSLLCGPVTMIDLPTGGIMNNVSVRNDGNLIYTDDIIYPNYTTYGTPDCAFYNNPPAPWDTDKITACNYDMANTNWDINNPILNARCVWKTSLGKCVSISNSEFIPLDFADIDPISPTDCEVNRYSPTASSTFVVPISGVFYNSPPIENPNITYYDLGFYAFDSQNNEASTTLLNSIASSTGLSYSGTLELAAGKQYRYEFRAKGYDSNGMYYSFVKPVCCSTVTNLVDVATSTAVCDWGTEKYLSCQNTYDNCISDCSGLDFTCQAVCGVKGAILSVFCPNPEALAKTKGIITDAQNRFPLTLINSFKNSLTTYGTNSDATTSATTTLIAADLSGFSGLKQISFISDLRTWVGYLLWIALAVFICIFSFKHLFTK